MFFWGSPLLFPIYILLGLVALRRKWKALFIGSLIFSLGPLFFVIFIENQWWSPSTTPGRGPILRLVNWNVDRGGWNWSGILDKLKAQKADLYVLGEFPVGEDHRETAKYLGSEYSSKKISNMAVILKGKIEREKRLGRWRVFRLQGELQGKPLDMIIVDLPSTPFLNHDETFSEINFYAKFHRVHFVVGDFNSPRRCRKLQDLPGGYRHAYLAAGRGWSYTWPVYYPFLAVDHCIFGPAVRPLRYDLLSSLYSDHRMQKFDFQWR